MKIAAPGSSPEGRYVVNVETALVDDQTILLRS